MISLEKITEKEYYCGITSEYTYKFMLGEQHIGYACINQRLDDSFFIEWIEFFDEFQGKGYIRYALIRIMQELDCEEILFESSEEHVEMYQHIGAVSTGTDEFTENTEMTIEMAALIVA